MAKTAGDRKIMKVAIEEMLQSQSEHANKFDPMVGAVLTDKKGRILARAHRGNFSTGEHAEFTVLEKLAYHKDTTGCTLYTTLEPCTVRTPPKMSCAERIIERRIGRVVIGISDPNPEIHGKGIDYLLDHGIKVNFFDSDLAQQIRDANTDFIDYFDRASEELRKPIKEVTCGPPVTPLEKPEQPRKDEKLPVYGAGIDDLSPDLIKEYLYSRGQSFDIPSLLAAMKKIPDLALVVPRGLGNRLSLQR